MVFGCGHHNRGSFSDRGSGIVGLGGGPLSLVSQLGSETDGKFSYCLLPMFENSTSKLNFGSLSIVSNQGVVSTPLISKNPLTYYYLTLEGISVGNTRIESKPTDFSTEAGSEGNIIIDSGTTLTLLNEELYDELESFVKAAIDVDTTDDPNEILSLCYNNTSSIQVPEMIFHFTNADLHLNRLNTFIQTPYASLICLAMMPSQTAIFGNYAQVNFQIEYDTVGKKVSFASKDCTKL
ncbi:aspartic proteinase CDR1-like isoform X3 [Papaver somniferum]|uniref:aspartic proteinase CDR1-like isoform X3 n=1 Tax=Papaver somniferum TaxID=3469 RepID=UPI000E6F577D|nr:aspartic proteinase CDR1-like isoform X3 [Papaver somniferum]